MPFVSEAWIDVDVSPEVAFDTLADHAAWKDWMPRSFVVASPATVPLHVGKRFTVKIAGLPVASSLEVVEFSRPLVLAWRGGEPNILQGRHAFHFSSDGRGGTKVHSHETWTGVLARFLRPVLKPAAERVGREQLAKLAAASLARARS